MAETTATLPASEAIRDKQPSELKVTVRLISPSRDLADFPVFADLPTSTTVGQIRTLVENELTARQRSSSGMRIIYRGRVLDVEERTLKDVFGALSIQETEVHTLHLVLRDNSNAVDASAINPPLRSNQPPHLPPGLPDAVPLGTDNRATAAGHAGDTPHTNPQAQTFFLHHQQLPQTRHIVTPPAPGTNPANAWMQHLDAHTRVALEIARQHNPALGQWLQPPDLAGNNGQYATQQVNLVPDAMPSGVESMRSVPSIIQGGGVNRGHQTGQEQQRRELLAAEVERIITAAGARPFDHASQLDYPTQATLSLTQSHNAASPQGSFPLQRDGSSAASGTSWGDRAAQGPDVYILESPTGPRALLINGSTEAYYTPATAGSASRPTTYTSALNSTYTNDQWHLNLIQQHNQRVQQQQHLNLIRQHMQHVEMLQRLQQQHLQRHPPQHPQYHQLTQHVAAQSAGQPALQPARPPPQAVPMGGHAQHEHIPNAHANLHRQPGLQPNHPGAGFLAAMWPHIWLVARLILFVWWFTAPTASWTRWTMVVLLAAAVFIANTGMLDGAANQVWAPVRAHLDGLLPFANPNAARQQDGQNPANAPNVAETAHQENDNVGAENSDPAAVVPIGRAGGPQPDPTEVAARLVAQRRNVNGARLLNFARRLERVGIMFLASLAPGIAERHVALVEEEERAERRRIQEAEETAAAAAAEADAAVMAVAEGAVEPAGEAAAGDQEGTGEDALAAEERRRNDQQPTAQAQEEPLIVI